MATSGTPSPVKSATTGVFRGTRPTELGGTNCPFPSLSSIVTLLGLFKAMARSSSPSPVKSPVVIAVVRYASAPRLIIDAGSTNPPRPFP